MPSKGIIFDFDGTLYGDWRLWISLIEETLREFNITVTGYEALEMARGLIRNGEARETLKISRIAVSLAKTQGLERDEEVRARFFEKLDDKMDETGPGNDLVRLLKRLDQKGFIMGIVTFVRKTRLTRRLDLWKLGRLLPMHGHPRTGCGIQAITPTLPESHREIPSRSERMLRGRR